MGRIWRMCHPCEVSYRPASAAKRPPERLQIGNRQLCRPGDCVIVAMNAAGVRAATGHSQLAIECRLAGTIRVAPGAIASEGADRRPIRHRWRQLSLIQGSKVPDAVDNLAADNGEKRCRVRNLILSAGEIVPVRNHQVGELTD